jgi:hypothetical protein
MVRHFAVGIRIGFYFDVSNNIRFAGRQV